MRSPIVLASTLAAAVSAQSSAGYVCPITPPQDATALEYAYAMQNFVASFYQANGDFSMDMFSGFPNASMTGMNGMPLSADLAANFNGLTKQAMLGVEGITQLSQNAGSGYMQPSCDYTYPPDFVSDASPMEFVKSAYFIEATMCGVFIGLADYVQTPTAAFLMARLAAEHGIHASFLGSYMKEVPYSADSKSLTPVFTPSTALMSGSGPMDVGMVGQYGLASCAPVPPAPCGGEVTVGMINAMLSSNGTAGQVPSGTASGSSAIGTDSMSASGQNGSMSTSPMPTYTDAVYEGEGSVTRPGAWTGIAGVAVAFMALM